MAQQRRIGNVRLQHQRQVTVGRGITLYSSGKPTYSTGGAGYHGAKAKPSAATRGIGRVAQYTVWARRHDTAQRQNTAELCNGGARFSTATAQHYNATVWRGIPRRINGNPQYTSAEASTMNALELKAQVNVPQYLTSKGYQLKGRGKEQWLPAGCPFCGTANPGHSDRFRVWADAYWCRNCGANGDVIQLAQELEHLSFLKALEELSTMTTSPVAIQKPVAPAPEKQWDTAYMTRYAEKAHSALMAGGPGAEYLTQRGIYPHIWETFRFGYATHAYNYPAIVIPWYHKGQVVGIKYRWLEKHNGTKAIAESGSTFRIYGGHTLRDVTADADLLQHRRLLLIEGELNAASAFQVAGDWLDILSIGGQATGLTPEQIAHFSKYGTKLVWLDSNQPTNNADDPRPYVQKKAESIGARYITSEKQGGDANDLLQKGTLGGTLVKAYVALTSGEQRKQLLWDLSEAISRPNADPAAVAMCEELKLWETHD